MGVAARLVIIVTVASIATLAQLGSCFAFDLQFGGRVRTVFGYNIASEGNTENGEKSVTRGFLYVPSTSYFRATFSSDDKKVGMRIEMGLGSSSMNRRHVFGWYRFGNFKITAGNTDNLFDAYVPQNQLMNNEDLEGWGAIQANRLPQIAISWERDGLQAQFAIRDHRNELAPLNLNTNGVDVYWMLPAMAGTISYTSQYFAVSPTLHWSLTHYEGDDPKNDNSAQSWIAKLPLKGTFGPFTLTGDIHYGENVAAEFASQPEFAMPVLNDSGSIKNTVTYGGFVSLQFKQETWAITTGAGYDKYENDAWESELGYVRDEYHRIAWYLNFAYQLHPNMTLYPEVLYEQAGEDPTDGKDSSTNLYVGMQIKFQF